MDDPSKTSFPIGDQILDTGFFEATSLNLKRA